MRHLKKLLIWLTLPAGILLYIFLMDLSPAKADKGSVWVPIGENTYKTIIELPKAVEEGYINLGTKGVYLYCVKVCTNFACTVDCEL